MDNMNVGDSMDGINKKAVAISIVVVLAVLALAVWGGSLLGKAQAATQNQDLSTKLSLAQDQLSQLQSQYSSLQNTNAGLQTQLSSAQGQISQLQSQYSGLQDTNTDVQRQLSSAKDQLSQLQSQYSGLQTTNVALQNTNAGLQTQLSSAQSQLSQLQSQYSGLQNTNTSLQTQLSSAQQQITTLQAQLGAWYTWARSIPSMPSTVAPSLTLSPASGPMGTSITVTGSGFAANSTGSVVFDINRNGISDPGETLQNVTTSSTGSFATTLVVPSVPPGTYPVLAAFPTGAQASLNFAVTS